MVKIILDSLQMLLANSPGLFCSDDYKVNCAPGCPRSQASGHLQALDELGVPPSPVPLLESPVQQRSCPTMGLAHRSVEI